MYSDEWSRNRQGREKSVITNFSFSQLSDEEKTGKIKPHTAQGELQICTTTNFFITDVDLHRKFTGTSIVFDMSLTYILVALSAVIVNNALVERLSLNTLICVGYLFALGPLVFVSVCDVWLELFDTQQFYDLTLAAIAIVAFGCTVQQSSFYGYTGMLPKRYTQGVMTGESELNFHHHMNEIITIILILCNLVIVINIIIKGIVHPKLKFAKNVLIHRTSKILINIAVLGLKIFDIAYDDFLAELLGQRCAVARVIWPYMLSILSELQNETLGEWLPILTMALFNLADFVGKILAACPYEWGAVQLLVCSCLCVLFLPLFVMCVSPVQRPLLAHPVWPWGLSLILGISNGYLGSVPMIQAAGKVPLQQREVAGNTMTVSYMAGLMLGSAVSYSTYSLTSQAHSTHMLKLNNTLTLQSYVPGH
uniref:Solute carrier family 29 member 4 n=1 Tax=Cyprinus carpio TaxID=7962 RepID=A0A8C1VHU0_CYPCA